MESSREDREGELRLEDGEGEGGRMAGVGEVYCCSDGAA
jgi:hypothetical protein